VTILSRPARRRRAVAIVGSTLASIAGIIGAVDAPVAGAATITDVSPMISSGGYSNLVLTSDGTALGFGSNSVGQLGFTANGSANPVPTAVNGVSELGAVSANEFHSLALKTDGTVMAWGTNEHGELGSTTNNGLNVANPPAAVSGLTGITAISAGLFHSAALDDSSTVWTFGDNFFGQLGRTAGSGANPTPTQVSGLSDVSAVEAGGYHTMVLRNDGTVWTFGRNTNGQLGVTAQSGGNAATDAPVLVDGLSDIVAIAAGQQHSVALRSDGTVWAWGSNNTGQIGVPANGTPNPTVAQVSGLTDIVAIAADEFHTLALRVDGSVWGFGSNTRGQLGAGGSSAPHQIAGLADIVHIAAGQEHSLAVDNAGKVWSLGRNNVGQLGVSTNSGSDATNATPLELGVSLERVTENSGAPRRLLDTRSGQSTVDGLNSGAGPVGDGTTIELQVTGRGGIPADATAVVLNLTATNPTGTGFLTAFPCGSDRPLASNLNYRSGRTVANVTVATVGTGGKVCLYNEGASTDLIVDGDRFHGTGAAFVPLTPARLVDTRSDGVTVDGQSAALGPRTNGTTTEITVAGRGGVASNAKAAALNITTANATGLGFLTVFPCGGERPLASNVSYAAGAPIANVTVAALGAGGKTCIYSEGGDVDVIVDVTAAHLPASDFRPMSPARLLDTRPGAETTDGSGSGAGPRGDGTVTELTVTGRAGVPFNVDQAVLNLTVTGGAGAGFLAAYPCGTPRPLASTLNYGAGQTVANATIVKVGNGGKVCVYNEGGATHLVADITGYSVL
jgi:alpha-tubulin suppressor-like RCC1 family protein